MGLFDKVFNDENTKNEEKLTAFFETFTAYSPAFTSFEGGIYEMELTRAIVHSFATHISKLKPEMKGKNNDAMERILQYKPNPFMDTSKFLYRLATVFMINNNAFIAPIYDKRFEDVAGFYPLLPENVTIKEHGKQLYIVYDFGTNRGAIEFEKAGILTQFQYKDDFFGSDNRALHTTIELMHAQNQGMIQGIKNGASIRFLAKLSQVLKAKDLESERKRFTETNLSANNQGGVLLFDQKYDDVKQIQSEPYLVDEKQMQMIKDNAFNYFGINENILQNKYTSDEWNAFYEGKIEPFALQLSLVMTNMLFSEREKSFGNEVVFTSNRLQYLTNSEKLNTVTQLFDRGFITHNQGLEIFNMPPRGKEGDKHYIRKEYAETKKLDLPIEEVESEE